MSSNNVILAADFDPTLVSFSEPKQLESGGRSIFLSYDNQPFCVQTPEMNAPFGMSNYRDRAGGVGPDKFTIDLSFKGITERPNIRAFFTMLETIDTMMVDYALANSQTLFKKRHSSAEVVAALYTPAIKFAKDRNTGEVNDRYPPTFKMALPQKDGEFLCESYDAKRSRIDLQDIDTKGSSVTAITRCVAIWVINGKFGVTWKALQLRVTPSSNLRGYAFRDDPVDDDAQTQQAVTITKRVKRGVMVADLDDEHPPPHGLGHGHGHAPAPPASSSASAPTHVSSDAPPQEESPAS